MKTIEMSEQEGIKIKTTVVDATANVLVVEINGYVDQANCHVLQKTIDDCLAKQFYNLVFDLQHLVYMSSAGWGVLIGEIKRFRENGGDIKLANMGPEIYEIYQMLEFYHIISEYASVADALKSMNVSSSPGRVEKKTVETPPPPPPKAPIVTPPPKPRAETPPPTPKPRAETPPTPKSPPQASPKAPQPERTRPIEEALNLPDDPAENDKVEETPEAPVYTPKAPVDENQGVIIDEEIDINIDGILANEGITKSGAKRDQSNYVEFDPDKYARRINIKVMPLPDKVRDIIANDPYLSVWNIRKKLREPEYGAVKIGYFKLKSLLKSLELDTKEKRYRFFRSA